MPHGPHKNPIKNSVFFRRADKAGPLNPCKKSQQYYREFWGLKGAGSSFSIQMGGFFSGEQRWAIRSQHSTSSKWPTPKTTLGEAATTIQAANTPSALVNSGGGHHHQPLYTPTKTCAKEGEGISVSPKLASRALKLDIKAKSKKSSRSKHLNQFALLAALYEDDEPSVNDDVDLPLWFSAFAFVSFLLNIKK